MIYPGEFSHDEFYLECCDGKPFLMLSPNDEMDDGIEAEITKRLLEEFADGEYEVDFFVSW